MSNHSPHGFQGRLTREEGEELQALRLEYNTGCCLTKEKRDRLTDLTNRCFLYGSDGVEAQPFVGLEPRYAGQDYTPPPGVRLVEVKFDEPVSLWHVSYGEEFQMPEHDPNRPKPSLWKRLKWRLEYRAQGVIDFVEEAWWRIVRAWRVL